LIHNAEGSSFGCCAGTVADNTADNSLWSWCMGRLMNGR